MKMMILENRALLTTMQAASKSIAIGSNPECEIHLADPKLPAHQANLVQDEDGEWWLEIVDRTVPTCLNRAIQKSRAKLKHADVIETGSFAIRLFMEPSKTHAELRRERMQTLTRQYGETLPLDTIIHKPDSELVLNKEQMEQITLLALRLDRVENAPDMMPFLLRTILRLLEGRRSWVGLRRPGSVTFDWSMATASTSPLVERPAFSHNMETRVLSQSQYLCVPKVPAVEVGSAMAVPVVCQSGTLGMLYVENDPGDPPYTEASLRQFNALACAVGLSADSVIRKVVIRRKQALATEQTVARLTQDVLTPKALPQWDNLLLAAFRHMGSAHCRDFYDIMQLRDKTASIVVARVKAPVDSLPRYFAELHAAFRMASLYTEPPHLFAKALNWVIYDGSDSAIDFACVWIAPGSGQVQYCTAGTGVQLARMDAQGGCEILPATSPTPLGQARPPALSAQTLDLAEEDTLVIVTEGVNTAINREHQVLGWAGVKENLCDGLGESPSNMLSDFANDLTEFLQGGLCPDDLTVLLAQRSSTV